MERQIVVTIGRSFGSNGRRIGEKLAKSLGIHFYDRNLIERASRESGIDWKMMGKGDEKLIGRVLKFAHQGGACKKRDDTHKMAEANKAFAHYKW